MAEGKKAVDLDTCTEESFPGRPLVKQTKYGETEDYHLKYRTPLCLIYKYLLYKGHASKSQQTCLKGSPMHLQIVRDVLTVWLVWQGFQIFSPWHCESWKFTSIGIEYISSIAMYLAL